MAIDMAFFLLFGTGVGAGADEGENAETGAGAGAGACVMCHVSFVICCM